MVKQETHQTYTDVYFMGRVYRAHGFNHKRKAKILIAKLKKDHKVKVIVH